MLLIILISLVCSELSDVDYHWTLTIASLSASTLASTVGISKLKLSPAKYAVMPSGSAAVEQMKEQNRSIAAATFAASQGAPPMSIADAAKHIGERSEMMNENIKLDLDDSGNVNRENSFDPTAPTNHPSKSGWGEEHDSHSKLDKTGPFHLSIDNVRMCHMNNDSIADCRKGPYKTSQWLVLSLEREGEYQIRSRLKFDEKTIMCLTKEGQRTRMERCKNEQAQIFTIKGTTRDLNGMVVGHSGDFGVSGVGLGGLGLGGYGAGGTFVPGGGGIYGGGGAKGFYGGGKQVEAIKNNELSKADAEAIGKFPTTNGF